MRCEDEAGVERARCGIVTEILACQLRRQVMATAAAVVVVS